MEYKYEVEFKVSKISLNSLLESFEQKKVKIVAPILATFVFTEKMTPERLQKVIDVFINKGKEIDLLHEVVSIKEVISENTGDGINLNKGNGINLASSK
jgi:hypothetical protein